MGERTDRPRCYLPIKAHAKSVKRDALKTTFIGAVGIGSPTYELLCTCRPAPTYGDGAV